jgi:hypothetical protein
MRNLLKTVSLLAKTNFDEKSNIILKRIQKLLPKSIKTLAKESSILTKALKRKLKTLKPVCKKCRQSNLFYCYYRIITKAEKGSIQFLEELVNEAK